jgi:hypothetical protein
VFGFEFGVEFGGVGDHSERERERAGCVSSPDRWASIVV